MAEVLELPDLAPQRRRVKIGAKFYELIHPKELGHRDWQWLFNKSAIWADENADEAEAAQALDEVIAKILPDLSAKARANVLYIFKLQIYQHWSAGFLIVPPEPGPVAVTTAEQTGVS